MKLFRGWKRRAAEFVTRELYALYLACKDPRVPWYAKLLAVGVAAYAFSPIDLIPDFIPVLGYLDDLILVPLGIYLVLKLIPDEVMSECRQDDICGSMFQPLSFSTSERLFTIQRNHYRNRGMGTYTERAIRK